MDKELFNKAVILGVGLMGGSLGMALKNRRLVGEVTGFFRERAKIEEALHLGAVDTGTTSLPQALQGADLVIVGTPVGVIPKILEEMKSYLEPGCIVTDLGSTKEEVTARAEEILPPEVFFVGGHPMTGSEEWGVKGANPYLLENAIYVLTATPQTDSRAVQALKMMVEEVGSQNLIMDPQEHDLLVAAVSHLPHLSAVTLVNTISETGADLDKALFLAAGGFKDTTRIAMGNPLMWRDICLSNREMILKCLKIFKKQIEKMEKHIEYRQEEGIERELEKARDLRKNIPERVKGLLPGIYDLVVLVGDVPGVIGKIATIFGNAGINIKDIEILKSREEGGSIRFSFSTLEDRNRAHKLLDKEKFQVTLR